MIIRGVSVMLFVVGAFLFILARLNPFFAFILMDWIGLFAMVGSLMILLIAFPFSESGMLYDTIPAGSAMIPFIRRDGIIAPVLGKRVFSGESFLDVPKLGLIEDLGAGTVLLWGRKKIRFGLENISYTPDMRYANLCATLRQLGFDDSEDLKMILNIKEIKDLDVKAYYLSRMAEVNWNMDHAPSRGAKRLVESFQQYKGPKVNFWKKKPKKPVSETPTTKPIIIKETPKPTTEEPKRYGINELHGDIDRRLK